jgi:uncharacterized protein YkwD
MLSITQGRILSIVLLTFATTSVSLLMAEPAQAKLTRSQQQEVLEAHNRYRQEVGVPNLVWSADLAKSAQKWADHLASLGGETLMHDDRRKHGQGENLAMGTAGAYSMSELVAGWGEEKQHFKAGKFPNVSKTRNWQDVGHYTQVVWRDTKQVGCAKATAGGNDILVCRYLKPGNRVGSKVF